MMPPIAFERFGPRNNPHRIDVKGAMKRLVGTLGVLAFFAIGAMGAIRLWNIAGSTYDAMTFPAHIAAGVSPRLKSADAYRITVDYLTRAGSSASAESTAATLESIWAVTADDAAALDGCIPTGKGRGIVWVTRGSGAALTPRAWAPTAGSTPAACASTGTAGTIVIDDATGQILAVYPYAGTSLPHPSPKVTFAPAPTPTPILPSGSAQPGASGSPRPSASIGGSQKPAAGGSAKPSASPKPSGTPKPSPSGG